MKILNYCKNFNDYWNPFTIFVANGILCNLLLLVIFSLKKFPLLPYPNYNEMLELYINLLYVFLSYIVIGSFLGIIGIAKMKVDKNKYRLPFFLYPLCALCFGYIVSGIFVLFLNQFISIPTNIIEGVEIASRERILNGVNVVFDVVDIH